MRNLLDEVLQHKSKSFEIQKEALKQLDIIKE